MAAFTPGRRRGHGEHPGREAVVGEHQMELGRGWHGSRLVQVKGGDHLGQERGVRPEHDLVFMEQSKWKVVTERT